MATSKYSSKGSLRETDPPAFWLNQEYTRRKGNNPKYSQRAFARFLGIASGMLSDLLSGKKLPSVRLGRRLSETLGYRGQTEAFWLEAISNAHKRRRETAGVRAWLAPVGGDYTEVVESNLVVMKRWYYPAILGLLKVIGTRWNVERIASRLGISRKQVQESLSALEKVGVVLKRDGHWVRTHSHLGTSQDIPSAALKAIHRQNLALASKSLSEIPPVLRDISSMVIRVDKKRMPLAKKMIQNFRRNLARLMEEQSGTEVYSLTIAFFPMTRVRETKS